MMGLKGWAYGALGRQTKLMFDGWFHDFMIVPPPTQKEQYDAIPPSVPNYVSLKGTHGT